MGCIREFCHEKFCEKLKFKLQFNKSSIRSKNLNFYFKI